MRQSLPIYIPRHSPTVYTQVMRSPLAPLKKQGGLIVNAIMYHRRGNQILSSGKTIIIGQRINEFIGSN